MNASKNLRKNSKNNDYQYGHRHFVWVVFFLPVHFCLTRPAQTYAVKSCAPRLTKHTSAARRRAAAQPPRKIYSDQFLFNRAGTCSKNLIQ